ncbi:MAG: hypothetical protein AMXMBFR49_20260 [Chlorobiota bacterium]
MTYNFCTLFDSNYLTRGLALHGSMVKHIPDFRLFIFAFDDRSHRILTEMNLKNTTVISLKEFEDPQLLEVKPTRSIAEYCWTSTSSTVLYILDRFGVDHCTYIDADICFYSSPEPIFTEMGDNSILLTEHRYSPQYNKEVKSGKYCVQFVTFRNDERGRKALTWWRDRCLEWCYDRYEDGKFGDQLYLDDWTERFEGVHVMQHHGGGLAAWNVQQYDFVENNGRISGKELTTGQQFDVIFYHYHYLRFFKGGKIELGRRVLGKSVLDIFYKPYIARLDQLKKEIAARYPGFDPNGTRENKFRVVTPAIYIFRKLTGVYNVFDENTFLRN